MQLNYNYMNKSYILAGVLAILAAAALFSTQSSATEEYSFEQYKADFRKTYSRSGEEHYRRVIFINNIARIAAHNADTTNSYRMGVNQFTDLTDAEFRAIYLTLQVPENTLKVENI